MYGNIVTNSNLQNVHLNYCGKAAKALEEKEILTDILYYYIQF